MKRTIKTFTLLICLYMAVISCGKDNSINSPSSLVGTWKYSESELLFNGKSTSYTIIDRELVGWTITFTKDGVMIDDGDTYNYIYSPKSNTLTEIEHYNGEEYRDDDYLKMLSPYEFVMSYGRDENDISGYEQDEYYEIYKGFEVYRFKDHGKYYYEYHKNGKSIDCWPLGDYDDSYEGLREYYDEELMHFKRID